MLWNFELSVRHSSEKYSRGIECRDLWSTETSKLNVKLLKREVIHSRLSHAYCVP